MKMSPLLKIAAHSGDLGVRYTPLHGGHLVSIVQGRSGTPKRSIVGDGRGLGNNPAMALPQQVWADILNAYR